MGGSPSPSDSWWLMGHVMLQGVRDPTGLGHCIKTLDRCSARYHFALSDKD